MPILNVCIGGLNIYFHDMCHKIPLLKIKDNAICGFQSSQLLEMISV